MSRFSDLKKLSKQRMSLTARFKPVEDQIKAVNVEVFTAEERTLLVICWKTGRAG